jgi:hypothetical protein
MSNRGKHNLGVCLLGLGLSVSLSDEAEKGVTKAT